MVIWINYFQKMNLNISKKEVSDLFIPGIIIVAGLIALVVVGFTQVGAIRNSLAGIEKLKKENQELKARHLMLSAIDETEIQRQGALAELAVPSEKNIPYILQSFRQAVGSSNYMINQLKFTPGEFIGDEALREAGKVEEMPLSAGLIGPTDDFNLLVKTLETSLPLFEVKNIELRRDFGEAHKTRVNLQLVAFYSPPLTELERKEFSSEEMVLNEQESTLLNELADYRRVELGREEFREIERRTDNPFAF